MDPSGRLNLGFIGSVVGIIIAIIVVFAVIRTRTPSSDSSFTGPFNLMNKSHALTLDNFGTPQQSTQFLKSGAASFSAFVYLDTISKTGEYVACGSAPNQPSCDSGVYKTCQCESAAACSNCIHSGYKKLFSLYDVYQFEALNIPDAGRQNAVSAQLSVLTAVNVSGNRGLYKETISLKTPFPLQKWVMITVVHEGRRIDVYYNDSLVASATLENMPTIQSLNGTYVDVGDTSLTGTIGCMRFYGRALKGGDVQSLYVGQVDTRGAPVELDTAKAEFGAAIQKATSGSLLERLCLDGSCISGGIFRTPTFSMGPIQDKTLSLGSIASVYAVDSPYA